MIPHDDTNRFSLPGAPTTSFARPMATGACLCADVFRLDKSSRAWI